MVVDGRVLGSCDTRLWGTSPTCCHVSGCPRRPGVPRTPPNLEVNSAEAWWCAAWPQPSRELSVLDWMTTRPDRCNSNAKVSIEATWKSAACLHEGRHLVGNIQV